MTAATPSKHPSSKKDRPQAVELPKAQLQQELRALLLPTKKWHYLFHLLVILTSLSYWIASRFTLPEASWQEIVMYRPHGDNQVYPVITALSRLNFGDPTDALNYGKGVAGFHAVILFPHAMLYALFGWAGYMIADAGFSWLYFVAVVLLLRRCNLGLMASLVLGSALATGSLQALTNPFNTALLKLVTIAGGEASEWHFPNLLNLQIFSKRLPRPMITEVLVAALLCIGYRLWRDPSLPTFKKGLAIGGCMSLLMQGDPYSFSVLGLVLTAVMVRVMERNQWRWPWPFFAGAWGSWLVVSSYFIYQMMLQEPDGAVRFGLYTFGRSRLMFLPGYGPFLRVGLVAGLSWLLIRAARRISKGAGLAPSENADANAATLEAWPVAQFCIVLVCAGWLAQPLQILLLGKGAQLYHYLIATLPMFYSYCLVLLICQAGRVVFKSLARRPAEAGLQRASRLAMVLVVSVLLIGEFLLGIESSLDAAHSQGTARDEINPWSQLGDAYRPNFRALDRAFRENPKLKQAKTFATFSHEVNFLLTAFHDKRAYLPDNGFTTLPDKELERRLFEVSKICMLNTMHFGNLIQNVQVMNYWLGCAKYWFALGHTYAPLSEYPARETERLKELGRQPVFSLVMPQNELMRLSREYAYAAVTPSEVKEYPDLIIMPTLLTQQGVVPHSTLYETAYTNQVFFVYAKKVEKGKYSAGQ